MFHDFLQLFMRRLTNLPEYWRVLMPVAGASQRIETTVSGWESITVHPHRFGGREFRVGKREVGHIHGDYLVDIPFPRRIRDELVAAHQAAPHHILPESGWVSVWLREAGDVDHAVALLQRSYELALQHQARRQAHTSTKEHKNI
jgi:predicted DNA-binding protein (MmcQ/YjbR family)